MTTEPFGAAANGPSHPPLISPVSGTQPGPRTAEPRTAELLTVNLPLYQAALQVTRDICAAESPLPSWDPSAANQPNTGRFPGRLNPGTLQAQVQAAPSRTHLGVTDPVTALLTERYPELGTLPFAANGAQFGLIGPVVIFDRGNGLERMEHDPVFAQQLLLAAAGRASSAAQALRELQWAAGTRAGPEHHYPELRHVPPEQHAALIRGGLRTASLYRALIPGATSEIRAALQAFTERRYVPTFRHRNQTDAATETLITGLRHLVRAGHLCECLNLIRAAPQPEFTDYGLAALPYMLRSGDWTVAHAQIIRDSLGLLEQLLRRPDLFLLDLKHLLPSLGPEELHDELLWLTEEPTQLEEVLREGNFAPVTALKAVPERREGQVRTPALTLRFTAAATSAELHDEARQLRHCVGGSFYIRDAALGHCELYRVQRVTGDQLTSQLTAEIRQGKLRQLRGQHNRDATPEEVQLVLTWLERTGLQHHLTGTAAGTWEPNPSPQATQLAAHHQAPQLPPLDFGTLIEATLADLELTEEEARSRERHNRQHLSALQRTWQRQYGTRVLNAARLPLRGQPWEAQIGGHWYPQGAVLRAEGTFTVRSGQAHLSVTTHTLSSGETVLTEQDTTHVFGYASDANPLPPEHRVIWEALIGTATLRTGLDLAAAARRCPDRQLTIMLPPLRD